MKSKQDQASPGRQRGGEAVIGAWVVKVMLLAPLVQCQERELEAVPEERSKEQMGLAQHRGPEPPPRRSASGRHCAGALPAQVPTCHLRRASPPRSAPLPG